MVSTLVLLMNVAAAAPAQPANLPPPPMVPASPAAPPAATPLDVPPPPPTPPPEPSTAEPPGTPPPPQLTPNQPPTTASPYGVPRAEEHPKVEWGLMISESLFGMLTAAGVSLLPYFLLLQPFVEGKGGGVFGDNGTVGAIIYVVLFAAIPLSTAQTEVSIANGSRWYYSETWPAALCGLAAEGAVLGLAYLTRGGALSNVPGQAPIANPYVLLIGTIGFTPLVQMAVINLFKSPRFGKPGGTALLNYKSGEGLRAGLPNVAPVFSASREGAMTGMQFSLLSGSF